MTPETLGGYLTAGRHLDPWLDRAVWFVWWTAPGVALVAAVWCAVWTVRITRGWIACRRAIAALPAVSPIDDLETHLDQAWARMQNETREEKP